MRTTITRLSAIAFLSILAAPAARAQYDKFPGIIKSIDVGYGYPMSWGTYDRHDKAVDASSGKVFDTTTRQNVKSSSGYSLQLGTMIPVMQLGKSSKLAIGVTVLYRVQNWDYALPNSASLNDSGFIKYDYSGGLKSTYVTTNIGAAISADVKFGVDAMMDKRYRWSWTGGIGVLPSVCMVKNLDGSGSQFNVQPFLKTEVGLRAGIVWKLCLLYQFLDMTYYTVSPNAGFFPGSQQTTTLTGHGTFTASLVVMPFSWMYKRSMWFNTPQ